MKQTSEEQQVLVFTSKDCFLDLKEKNPHQFYDLKFIIPFLQGKHHLISFLKNLTTTFKKNFQKKKIEKKKLHPKLILFIEEAGSFVISQTPTS